MGIHSRSSYGLRQQSSYNHNNTLPALPESPSSLPDTSSQPSSTSSHSSSHPSSHPSNTTQWTQASQHPAECGNNVVPAEQRQNPRRSSSGISKPPTLVRQDERKVSFVDSLVDSATQMVEVIWPLSVAPPPCRPNTSGVLSLRRYIEETLRRSRTSYSTLQVALYYLVLIMPFVPKCDFTREQLSDSPAMRSLQCGRRMFLSALILASKYLQDRNYSAKAWSKMSGLKVAEINMNERAFLQSVNWKLHIPDNIFKRWTDVVLRFTPSQFPPPPSGHALSIDGPKCSWREIVPLLTPELDTVPMMATPAVADAAPPAQTPFANLPSFLEPEPEVAPPTPAFVGTVASLPTPRSTPPRSPTPAVSVASVESWPLMRAPLSRSTSTVSSIGSSPESTYSDASRLSRSSSISSVATSVTSVSSQPSVSAQACLAKLATCRNSKLYPQSLQQHVAYNEATHSNPVIVLNEALMASPISIVSNEDVPFTTEDAPLSLASRVVKRSYSERDDEDDSDAESSILQFRVREAIREQQRPRSMPVIVEDANTARPSYILQHDVQQMMALSRGVLKPRKRVCVSVQ